MKKGLKSSDKLKLKSEFDNLKKNGKKILGKSCILLFLKSEDEQLRCGIICSRKYSRKAVERNRARRLIWESFRLLKSQIKAAQILIITRQQMKGKKQKEVQKELKNLLLKAELIKKKES